MGDMWDVTLGARAGIWRYGNDDPNWPEGWQLDIEGAVFRGSIRRASARRSLATITASAFRSPMAATAGNSKWVTTTSAPTSATSTYCTSIRLPTVSITSAIPPFSAPATFSRRRFARYGEVGYAAVDGGAKPIELQFGCEWVQARNTGARGGPFAAINADLRQEVDYGGNVSVQFGWMWRQYARGPNARIGAQYFYGKEDEYEFFTQTVSRFGWGIWYDF